MHQINQKLPNIAQDQSDTNQEILEQFTNKTKTNPKLMKKQQKPPSSAANISRACRTEIDAPDIAKAGPNETTQQQKNNLIMKRGQHKNKFFHMVQDPSYTDQEDPNVSSKGCGQRRKP